MRDDEHDGVVQRDQRAVDNVEELQRLDNEHINGPAHARVVRIDRQAEHRAGAF